MEKSRFKMGMKCVLSRAAALALAVLIAVPAIGVTAFAAENEDNEGGDVRQHVITGYGPGEFQHNEDCRREKNGVLMTPADEGFRHDDRFCYKAGLDAGTVDFDPDEIGAETGAADGEEDAADDNTDAVIHDDTCFQRDALVCGKTEGDDHTHDATCRATGWVNDTPGMVHDDDRDIHVGRLSSPKASTMADSMLADAGFTGKFFDFLNDGVGKANDVALYVGDEPAGVDEGGPNFEPLPSTGGEGIAVLLALGMIGAVAGASVLMGTRRRIDG